MYLTFIKHKYLKNYAIKCFNKVLGPLTRLPIEILPCIIRLKMNLMKCSHCKKLKIVSKILSLCKDCLISEFQRVKPFLQEIHEKTRLEFGLPLESTETQEGLLCPLCLRRCSLKDKDTGFCGLVQRKGSSIINPGSKIGYYSWYYDPLPTNCVADWICPGGTGCGYPEFVHRPGPEYGKRGQRP